MLGGILTGLIGGLGNLFGGSKKQDESFTRDSTNTSTANMQDLSPELLKGLESLLGGQFKSGNFDKATNAMSGRLQQLIEQSNQPGFDVNSFVEGITKQAVSAAGLQQESDINGMLGALGSSEGGNSMSALLGNKIRNATAANIGGVASQAMATGKGIQMAEQDQITQGIGGLSQGLTSQILGLVQNTRGANVTSTGTVKESSKGTGKTTSSESNPFGFLTGFLNAMGNAKRDA